MKDQLCIITISDKFYILDLLLNEHQPIPYNSRSEAQQNINNQIELCKIYCN